MTKEKDISKILLQYKNSVVSKMKITASNELQKNSVCANFVQTLDKWIN